MSDLSEADTLSSSEANERQPQAPLSTRLIASSAASILAALVVTPLDVLKTRMQAETTAPPPVMRCARPHGSKFPQESSRAVQLGANFICKILVGDPSQASGASRAFRYTHPAFALELCPACGHIPSETSSSSSSSSSSYSGFKTQRVEASRHRPNAMQTLREILRRETGFFPKGLWRGLDISLAVTIPMVGIYMPLYDTLSTSLGGQGGVLGPLTPAAAGMGARAVAVFATAPLELIRTQRQATLASSKASPSPRLSSSLYNLKNHLSTLSRSTSLAQISAMWLGVGATLWRDVPFTGIYWLVVEPMRARLLDIECQLSPQPSSSSGAPAKPTQQQVLWANLISGGISGALAAVLTTPFDLVKTRMQVAGLSADPYLSRPPSLPSPHPSSPPSAGVVSRASSGGASSGGAFSAFSRIWREEGLRGLFTGVGPRAARTAPACAIVITTYESVKHALAQ